MLVFISSLVFFIQQNNSELDNITNDEIAVATKEFKHAASDNGNSGGCD